MKNFGAAAENAGPGQHIESLGCEYCNNMQKIAKICVCCSRTPKFFCKDLAKLCEELRLLQYHFAKFLPVIDLPNLQMLEHVIA